MKIIQLPKGNQRGFIGPCVSIPTDIEKTTNVLPRSENEAELIRCKLKRKLEYKGYCQYEFVSRKKICKGLEYLQQNNPYYHDKLLNDKWIEHIPSDFKDLVTEEAELTEVLAEEHDKDDKNHDDEDISFKDRGLPSDTCLQPVDLGQEILDQHFDDIFCVAQYLSELEQVISKVSIALRKSSGKDKTGNIITARMLTDKIQLKRLLTTDQGYKFMTPIRGTPPYWQATLRDLMASIRQLGIPTWFATFSAADLRWKETLQVLLEQQKSTQSLEDLGLDWIEFQQRGSPHAHCLFWIKDAPLLDTHDDKAVCDFVDSYVTCGLPSESADPELHEIVSSVQQHSKSHSKSCAKKGTECRFNFPRPPSKNTFISRTSTQSGPSVQKPSNQRLAFAKDILLRLWKTVNNTNIENITTQNLFIAAGITQEEFETASNVLTKRTTVTIKRKPADIWINQYNPTLLRCWNANMDLQYITDAYSCVMYIISYISKAEREMGLVLENATKEAAEGNCDAQDAMKKIGGAYFRQREVSAQEATYRACGLHLKESSRKVQFLPVVSLDSSKEPQQVKTIVESNRHLFEQNADELDEAQDLLEKQGPLEDAWALIAPESEAERLEAQVEKEHLDDEDGSEIPDLDILNKKSEREQILKTFIPIEESLRKNAVRYQFPLQLAWACTTHKVQGITTDKAVISMKNIFAAGMAYVALSRVKSKDGLLLQDLDEDKIYCTEQISTALQRMPKYLVEQHYDQNLAKSITYIAT
ncbi:Hypothetical predicted protein [Mytilus galloprovincialis]|uniref:Helitron helicase-like domain-containing protein n=1 Tax=Mytilus galloprovincialis TaxID=29158 RepID=A0A8B6D665_MYTGA|nr:Hypothetical predicted protein [Mytilus galloprovincialis]